MERQNTTMRAARYLLGAGTLAAAMLAMTAGSASAQTSVCYLGGEGDPTFCGHVFTDTNTDGSYDDGEGVADVYVAITDASHTNVANSPTPSGSCPDAQNCGYYSFVVFEPAGTEYWICLVTDPNHADCTDTAWHPESVKVTVGEPPFHDFKVGDGGSEELPSDIWGDGTGTPGYWKNHPEAWPLSQIVIGDPSVVIGGVQKVWTYSKKEAIALLSKPVSGDKTVTIFASLVSAILNIQNNANNPTCIANEIADAQHWFALYGPVLSGVKAKSDAWVGGVTNTFKAGEPIHTKMDDYNNGLLCAPHRD